MELSVIIVNYNSKEYLLNCLDSLKNHLNAKDTEIVVIENASGDGDFSVELKKYHNLRFIHSKKNLGFGGANNLGVLQSSGDYILLLNPDTLVLDDSIGKMLSCLKKMPEIGILGPVLATKKDGVTEADHYGDFPTLKTVVTRNNQKKNIGSGNLIFAERITGACMLMKKENFLEIGGFDSNFFMYFEDTDLCKRFFARGFKNAILKEAKIVHFGGKSQSSSKRKNQYFKNQDYFFLKHYGPIAMILLKILRLPYQLLVKAKADC